MPGTSHKLNALMTLCGASNIQLSRALNVDASLVSRWRSGSRRPKAEYCLPLATWFAEHSGESYQKKALAALLGLESSVWAMSRQELAAAISQWLSQGVPAWEDLPAPESGAGREAGDYSPDLGQPGLFWGPNSTHKAMMTLLRLMKRQGYRGRLLIFSDDPPEWLCRDGSSSREALAQLYQQRQDIRLVSLHPRISRAADVARYLDHLWILCRFANASPYQYPLYRSGSFRQFICLAPGLAAVAPIGFSDSSATLLFEPELLRSLEAEFDELLAKSQPLFRYYESAEALAVAAASIDRYRQPGDIYSLSQGLPLVTMPPPLLGQVMARVRLAPEQREALLEAMDQQHQAFLRHIEKDRCLLAAALPDPAEIKAGDIPIATSGVYFGETVYYDPDSFGSHLNYVLELLERYPGLQLYCSDRPWQELLVEASPGGQAMIYKTTPPAIAMSARDDELAGQIYMYLEHELDKLTALERNRLHTIKRLRRLVRDLE